MKKQFVLFAATIALMSCYDPGAQSSAVVRQIEAAGSGDISSSTELEIAQWIVSHPEKRAVLNQINEECSPLRSAGTANWAMRTAEGRVCTAVGQIASYAPREADQTAY